MRYSAWPGLAQVFQLARGVIMKKSEASRHDVVAGVTSLGPDQAGRERLLGLVRQPWQIENQVHWVRDVTFDEARSAVRCGSLPRIMAAFRNTAIGLMHWAGERNIAAACRRFAAQPWLVLALIGIRPDDYMTLILPQHVRSKGMIRGIVRKNGGLNRPEGRLDGHSPRARGEVSAE